MKKKEPTKYLSTSEAAEYLGMKLSSMCMHVYSYKNIEPAAWIGNHAGFTKEQLDEFKATKRKRGRPKKENQ